MKNEIQLTFGKYGHTLHHCQIISPDNEWIVYDTRNADADIGITTRIERVNMNTKVIEVLYEVKSPTAYGPGVGAVTYSPNKERIIFIHGLNNASNAKPYGMSRRTGVAIDVSNPNIPIYMDARNVISPYTKGALRGGTHSHCWNFNGEMISFTYNDNVLAENNIPNERVVGVMFPKLVEVPKDFQGENISGEMFSVIISQIVERAENGSDEIEKAFDECWLGNKRTIVFQGLVRDEFGNLKTEIYKVDLPFDLSIAQDNLPLEGTSHSYPNLPKGIFQERVSCTPNGVSSFRHWLRASPNGDYVYLLMEDASLNRNIFCLNIENKEIIQLTTHDSSIHSPFNISLDGEKLIYFCNSSLYIYSIKTNTSKLLVEKDENLYGIPNFDKKGSYIFYNKYVYEDCTSKFLQIFKIKA